MRVKPREEFHRGSSDPEGEGRLILYNQHMVPDVSCSVVVSGVTWVCFPRVSAKIAGRNQRQLEDL